ncbi:MAG: anthranilate synthase component I family protein [Leeuwenhoekiella sp.]
MRNTFLNTYFCGVNRVKKRIEITDLAVAKKNLLVHYKTEKQLLWLDSNGHEDAYSSYEALLGVGAAKSISSQENGAFDALSNFRKESGDWLLGYLSYDLKNDLEDLSSHNTDRLAFAPLYFFQPKKLFLFFQGYLEMHYLPEVADDLEKDAQLFSEETEENQDISNVLKIEAALTKVEYCQRVGEMQGLIHRGEIYEANFCQEFYAKGKLQPLPTFLKFNDISRAPFAAYFRSDQQYLLCTSPERYLNKKGTKVISQPIKGTSRRNADAELDRILRDALEKNPKERAENIMITDLVRNDLSRTANKGSVTVENLCEPKTYKQVHQLVTTVTADVNAKIDPIKLLRTTFPMGSMTGAPKVSAMQIIEKLETTKRGLYSGAVGYIDPGGDFDFNVVIRSILYDAVREQISFMVGSAITAKASAEQEYDECFVKAWAMYEVLCS